MRPRRRAFCVRVSPVEGFGIFGRAIFSAVVLNVVLLLGNRPKRFARGARSRRMAQPLERTLDELADALAGHAQTVANLLERFGIAFKSEPPPDDFCFAIRKPGDEREDDRARARAARVVLGAQAVDIDENIRPGERCAVADRVVE